MLNQRDDDQGQMNVASIVSPSMVVPTASLLAHPHSSIRSSMVVGNGCIEDIVTNAVVGMPTELS
jgi:hypothetical protein